MEEAYSRNFKNMAWGQVYPVGCGRKTCSWGRVIKKPVFQPVLGNC